MILHASARRWCPGITSVYPRCRAIILSSIHFVYTRLGVVHKGWNSYSSLIQSKGCSFWDTMDKSKSYSVNQSALLLTFIVFDQSDSIKLTTSWTRGVRKQQLGQQPPQTFVVDVKIFSRTFAGRFLKVNPGSPRPRKNASDETQPVNGLTHVLSNCIRVYSTPTVVPEVATFPDFSFFNSIT